MVKFLRARSICLGVFGCCAFATCSMFLGSLISLLDERPGWLTIRNTCMLGWLLCVYWAHLQLSFLSALASSSRALA